MSKDNIESGGDRGRERERSGRLFDREERRGRMSDKEERGDRLFDREEPRGGKARARAGAGRAYEEDLELFHEFGRDRQRGWSDGKSGSWS